MQTDRKPLQQQQQIPYPLSAFDHYPDQTQAAEACQYLARSKNTSTLAPVVTQDDRIQTKAKDKAGLNKILLELHLHDCASLWADLEILDLAAMNLLMVYPVEAYYLILAFISRTQGTFPAEPYICKSGAIFDGDNSIIELIMVLYSFKRYLIHVEYDIVDMWKVPQTIIDHFQAYFWKHYKEQRAQLAEMILVRKSELGYPTFSTKDSPPEHGVVNQNTPHRNFKGPEKAVDPWNDFVDVTENGIGADPIPQAKRTTGTFFLPDNKVRPVLIPLTELISLMTEVEVDDVYYKVRRIYYHLTSGDRPQFVSEPAEQVYAILQGHDAGYGTCFGWEINQGINPLVHDPQFLTALFRELSTAKRLRYVTKVRTPSRISTHSQKRGFLRRGQTYIADVSSEICVDGMENKYRPNLSTSRCSLASRYPATTHCGETKSFPSISPFNRKPALVIGSRVAGHENTLGDVDCVTGYDQISASSCPTHITSTTITASYSEQPGSCDTSVPSASSIATTSQSRRGQSTAPEKTRMGVSVPANFDRGHTEFRGDTTKSRREMHCGSTDASANGTTCIPSGVSHTGLWRDRRYTGTVPIGDG